MLFILLPSKLAVLVRNTNHGAHPVSICDSSVRDVQTVALLSISGPERVPAVSLLVGGCV